MIIKWSLLINANKKRKCLHRILTFYSWHSFCILLGVRNENFQFILFKQFSGTKIRAKLSLLSVGCQFPPCYLMAVCYLWLWFGLLLCMVYGLALCFLEFPNWVWSRPRFSFENAEKWFSLCGLLLSLFKALQKLFPPRSDGESSGHADIPRKMSLTMDWLCALGLKDPSLANRLSQGQPYQSRSQCKEKEQAYLGSAWVKGRWQKDRGAARFDLESKQLTLGPDLCASINLLTLLPLLTVAMIGFLLCTFPLNVFFLETSL